MGRGKIIILPTSTLRKKAGFMRKLLGQWDDNKKTTKVNPMPNMTHGCPDFLRDDKGLDSKYVNRRQIVLNRHFTEVISDVLANNLRTNLSDIGVRVTSIETKAWNEGIRVYYARDKSFNQSIHVELNSLVAKLRSAVAERQLIGRTPHIHFVYDKTSEIYHSLDAALEKLEINEPKESTEPVRISSSGVQTSKTKYSGESKFFSKTFSAPEDMGNTVLGLDYPMLYNEVATKLERGRAESSRMSENVTLMSQKPMFRAPFDNIEDSDPIERVLKMQKFLISQRKKSDFAAKLRRRKELLQRDAIKWDVPEADEEGAIDTMDENFDREQYEDT